MWDLIDTLEQLLSPVDIIILLEDIIDEKYLPDLEKYAIKHNICPYCLGELTIRYYSESRGEHFGFPATEVMEEIECYKCGVIG